MTYTDISLWQGQVNFTTMKQHADGVFIKSSEANFMDPRFTTNWSGAKAAGLKRGAYHFYRVAIDPSIQVRVFIEAMAGDYGELAPVVDVEDTNATAPLTAKQVADLKWFIDVLHRFTGIKPMIYTGAWYWDPYMPLATWSNQYDLWVANYVTAPTGTPYLPTAWSTYKFWQWTSSGDGSLYGVSSSDIDLSVEYGDTPPPKPTHPAPTFTISRDTMQVGDTCLLVWSADGASGIYLDGAGVTGPTNSKIVHPVIDTTYTLKVTYDNEPDVILTASVKVTQPVPQPTTKTRIGVNIIGGDYNAIEYWYAAGCRRFQITFNPDSACQLKQRHPDCDVSHRALFYGGHLPSLQEFQDKHGYCLDAANKVRVFGVNENDQIGDGGQDGGQPDEIRQRAEWDGQMWNWCKARGVTFVGGGYAMGTPNIVVPAIRAAMRAYYAPLFNAGMRFNQHMYTGNDHSGISVKQHIYSNASSVVTWDGQTSTVRQTWWLEERPRFYVAYCGFDGSKSVFDCDETGVDGPGPFNDFGFTDPEKTNWGAEWVRRNSEPMPNGTAYHVDSGTLFADGDYNRWKAFADSIKPATLWKGVY